MMLTLKRPDSKVRAFMGDDKGVNDRDVIRPSIFAIPLVLGERKLVLNTFTGHCVETECFSWFECRDELVYDEKNSEMKDLVAYDFLVARDHDEVKKYESILTFLRRVEKTKPDYTSYTILPTTHCNARCFYCYEAGVDHETMSDEVVEQTIRYIHATRREDADISFRWFGGEPLIGEAIIDRICGAMREAEIKYSSSMITNGSLITEELAAKAKEDWQMTSVQITLDGREEVYSERKRYVRFEGSPYRTVLDGIHHLLDRKISVSIRLNVDEGNLEELEALVDELEAEFEDESEIYVYCHSIFVDEEDEGRDSDDLYDGMARLDDRIARFNRNRREISVDKGRSEEDEKYYDRRGILNRHFCMVDNPESGPVIQPNGSLTLCEHIGELPEAGSVFDEKPVFREDYYERNRFGIDKCRQCGLLPICTDFTSCPSVQRDCYRETLLKVKRDHRMLEKEQRLPPVNMRVEEKVLRVTEPDVELLERARELIVPEYLKSDETIDGSEMKKRLSKGKETK